MCKYEKSHAEKEDDATESKADSVINVEDDKTESSTGGTLKVAGVKRVVAGKCNGQAMNKELIDCLIDSWDMDEREVESPECIVEDEVQRMLFAPGNVEDFPLGSL
ncbi:hypothetical protein Peur_068837 [Populus x canadensis]